MSDIAMLGLGVDSGPVLDAIKDLEKLVIASTKAENSAKKLGSSTQSAYKSLSGSQLYAASKAVAEMGNEVEKLRTKYNPLYAASKQFETSQAELNRALELGAINAKQYDAAMTTLQGGMIRSATGVKTMGQSVGATNGHMSNMMFQFQDIGMMLAAGQNPLMLAVQQGTQVAGIFRQMEGSGKSAFSVIKGGLLGLLSPTSLLTLGVIAGGAALVQWGMSALGASEDTKSFRDNVDSLESSVSAVNEISKIYTSGGLQSMVEKYGEVNAEILAMVENQKTFAISAAMADAQTAVSALRDEYGALLSGIDDAGRTGVQTAVRVEKQLGLTRAQASELRQAMIDASTAATFDDQAAALRRVNELLALSKVKGDEVAGAALDAESAMRQLANSAPASDWMSAAISGVASLGEAIRARIVEANRLRELSNMTTGNADWAKGPVGFTLPGSELLPPEDKGGTGGTSGTSGGATDPYAANLERLVESLQTERETADAWYQENLLILEDRRALEIIGEQSHKEALLALEYEYQSKIVEAKQKESELVRNAAKSMYGELGGLLSQFGAKSKAAAIASIALNKGLRIGEIIQNTAAAQVRALAELGPIAGAAAAARIGLFGKIQAGIVAASGLSEAASAGGGGGGGGGGASATTSATEAAQPEQVTRVELVGDDWLVDLAESMMTQIYDASSNGRVIISKASA